jgi:hypothetical protein
MTTFQELRVSVLLVKEGDYWVAQCLDYDIAAQGASIEAAKESFGRVFVAKALRDVRRGRQPLSAMPPAPPSVHERFRHGAALADRMPMPIPEGVPAPYMIRAVAEQLHVA